MNEERHSIARNNIWTETFLPLGKDAFLCKVGIKQKQGEHGCIACFKARLVANGYLQKDCVDYDKIFAPVIPLDELFLNARKFTPVGWLVHHAENSTALLGKDIDSALYI